LLSRDERRITNRVGVEDSGIQYAIDQIYSTYGDVVSVSEKKKALNKFGSNTVGTSFETIQEFQSTELHETFVSTNLIDAVISSSTSDTTDWTFEGHTIDGSGNLTFVTQTITLTGQTSKALTTPLARVTRGYATGTGSFGGTPYTAVGNIHVYDNTDGDNGSGVPTTATATKMMITAGNSQSRKCATAISQNDYWILTQFSAAISDAAASTDFVTFVLETRDIANGGSWRPTGREIVLKPDNHDAQVIDFHPYRVVPKNHDVRVIAATDASTAPVFAEVAGYLASIQT